MRARVRSPFLARVLGIVVALVLVTTLPGCASPASHAPSRGAAGAAASSCPSAPRVTEPRATFAELVARGATAAPRMREVQQATLAGPGAASERVVADRDLCVRAVYEASGEDGAPRALWLEDSSNAPLTPPSKGTQGLVPPQGPVCVHKGDRVRLVFQGTGVVRAVLLASP